MRKILSAISITRDTKLSIPAYAHGLHSTQYVEYRSPCCACLVPRHGMTVQVARNGLLQGYCGLDDLAVLLIPLVDPMIWGDVHCIILSREVIAIQAVRLQDSF